MKPAKAIGQKPKGRRPGPLEERKVVKSVRLTERHWEELNFRSLAALRKWLDRPWKREDEETPPKPIRAR